MRLSFLHFFFLLLRQLPPGGEVLLALLQHRGHRGHQRAEQRVARDTDPSQEPNLAIFIKYSEYYNTIFLPDAEPVRPPGICS